ncbi:MAG: hypothetical protein A3H27_06100 [Acidobacteria bacterium RIFCSPLOWO2_02_FULL_59_13]|nr:MAG: hypothetical protein A3H27_06100 [Acidobacteria bacterium RIFCSPLOWO2_02_FULL_59_13]
MTKMMLLLVVWLLTASFPALAQVERVVVEAEGISVACTPGLEIALKSLDSIYKYAISVEKQMVSVTYFSGERFEPKKLRWAVDKGEAEVVRFHVSGVGKVQQEGEQQFFVSGEDRFLIVNSSKLPADVSIGVVGVVDDSTDPMQMKPDDFKVLTEPTPPKD